MPDAFTPFLPGSLAETLLTDPLAPLPPRPAGELADRTRVLVEAAYGLLHEEGLEGLTIRAVLKRTGLARRAFYERFAGKDDLVLAVFEHALHGAAGHFRRLAEGFVDPFDKLHLIVSSIVLGAIGAEGGETPSDRRGAALSREHLRLAESRPAELQVALAPLLGLIAEIVAQGIAEGRFRACDPALQATFLYNLVSTTVHTELLAEESGLRAGEERQRLEREIWEFCRRAIAA